MELIRFDYDQTITYLDGSRTQVRVHSVLTD